MKTKRILNWCNSVRKALKLKPVDKLLPGFRCDGEECAIANTLRYRSKKSISIDGSAVYIGPKIYIDTPKFISDFIYEFDSGRAPKELYLK